MFSPDGKTIAFAREADGRRHIWLVDPDGANQRQLTSGRCFDDVVSFSEDGSELNFYRSPMQSLRMTRNASDYAIDFTSNKMRKLKHGRITYSVDGRLAAYNKVILTGLPEIWIMDGDGSNERFLTYGHSPQLSRDGETVMYATGTHHLWKMIDSDGTNDRELGSMEGPVFAPDGKHILCLSPEWERQLWKLDLDGSHRETLPAPTGYIDFFRPCKDGFILKIVTEDRVGDIDVVDTNDWKVERVASMK